MRTPVTEYETAGLDFDFKPFDADLVQSLIAATFSEQTRPNVSDEKINEIVEVLNRTSQWHKYQSGADTAPTDRQINKTLEQIASFARKLNELLPVREEMMLVGEEVADAEVEPVPYQEDLSSFDEDWGNPVYEPCNPYVPRQLSAALAEPLAEELRRETAPQRGHRNAADDIWNDPGFTANAYLVSLSRQAALLARAAEAAQVDPENGTRSSADKEFAIECMHIYAGLSGRNITVSRSSRDGTPSGPLLRFVTNCFEAIAKSPMPSGETIANWARTVSDETPR